MEEGEKGNFGWRRYFDFADFTAVGFLPVGLLAVIGKSDAPGT